MGNFFGSSGGGSTTTIQKSDPWAGQAPYLSQGFNTAQGLFFGIDPSKNVGPQGQPLTIQNGLLGYTGDNGFTPYAPPSSSFDFMKGSYNPQYFNDSAAGVPSEYNAHGTVAGFTPNQEMGASGMLTSMFQNEMPIASALDTAQKFGTFGYLNANNPGNSIYDSVASNAMNNPANPALQYLMSGGAMDDSSIGGLHGLAGTAMQGTIGNDALGMYASGAMLGSQNPAWKQLTDSVTASTLPALEGQFTQGGAMNNPNAHYEIANGLASALAPYAEENYNTQTQNQIGAAGTLGSLFNNQVANATGALSNAGNLFNTGIGNTLGATGQLSNNFQTGLQQKLAAAAGLSSNYNTANQQAIQNELAIPGLASANTNNAATQFNVGSAQQQQNQAELSDLVNKWNYNQNLPLNMLNAYQSATSGNYGSTNTLTQPYFTNPLANALGTGTAALGLYNGLQGSGILSGLGSALGSAGVAANGGDALAAMAAFA